MVASHHSTWKSATVNSSSAMDAVYTAQSRASGNHQMRSSSPAHSAVTPTMTMMLNTALPTIVPSPSVPPVTRMVTTAVNSSGADEPAAMKVAPATSSESDSASLIASRDSQK